MVFQAAGGPADPPWYKVWVLKKLCKERVNSSDFRAEPFISKLANIFLDTLYCFCYRKVDLKNCFVSNSYSFIKFCNRHRPGSAGEETRAQTDCERKRKSENCTLQSECKNTLSYLKLPVWCDVNYWWLMRKRYGGPEFNSGIQFRVRKFFSRDNNSNFH